VLAAVIGVTAFGTQIGTGFNTLKTAITITNF
jgi:hypothetical protein